MKRAKDEEKIMGPMFPRLHVNDTEKGGPRAPPRNKMALYEQLSIPSQRFNNGMLPLNPNNNSDLVPAASSSQGNGYGRGMLFPLQLPSSHPAEKLNTSYSDLNTPSVQLEHKKKLDESDFRVPIFVQSEMNGDHGNYNGNNYELSTLSPAYMGHSTKNQRSCYKEPNQINNMCLNRRQDGRNQSEEKSREIVSGRTHLIKCTSSQSLKEKPEGFLKQTSAVSRYEHNGHLANNNGKLSECDSGSQQCQRVDSRLGSSTCDLLASNKSNKGINNGISSLPMGDFQSQLQRISNNHVMDIDSYEDRVCRSEQTGNVDRGDDVSEASMLDSISGLDISPDDIVGIIGQKQFWKFRRAIINQQRVFAVQVFELHRLIKVQRLIAGSPHLLIEDNAYLGRPITGSTVKTLPLEYVLKAPSKISKHKESDKQNHKMEGSAENAMDKLSLPFSQNGTQPSNDTQSSGNHKPTAFPFDPKLSPWCFHQPAGHQWLIPVMSPSEGLVYKLYPGPGFTNSVCGSPGSTLIMGNFLNPAYGHHPHQHYQGMIVPLFPTSAGLNSYFPPYGMPVMYPPISASSVEQMNHFTGPGLHGHPSGGSANFNKQLQNTSNLSSQKNGAVSNGCYKLHASKDSELQISTASSPSDRMQRIGTTNTSEVRNALPLFPTSPAVYGSDFASQAT